MTLRSRLASASAPGTSVVPVAKVYGNAVPAQIRAAEQAQGMTPATPFSPGEPIGPYNGYSRQPRTRDFVAGYNIATRPRLHERVSFDTLTGLIDAYDVAQMCIWHRIDTLRAVKWRLVPADGYSGDVEGAIELGKRVLRKPDRRHYFKNWLAKWLYDVLAYDAGSLYRLRNRGGRCIGLQPVDGTSLAPLLDDWGNEPEGDAPAFVQYVQGLPWDWLTRSDLIYEPMRGVNKSIYGKAPIETVILNANTDIRTQLHFLQRFTDGNIPEAFAGAPESWTPDQIENWQNLWDSFMYGDQTRKSQIRWMPGGSSIMWSNEKDFTDAFSLFMMRKTCATFHVVPTDLGFTESSNYSTGESQADVAHKVGELPLMEYVEEILSQFVYDDLQLPLKFEFDRGEDQDDRLVQAQADDIYIKNGTLGTEEAREMRYGLPKSYHPVPRFVFTERGGPVPLNALIALAGQIDPETGAPAEGAPLPRTAFGGVPAVIADPPVLQAPLAVDEYGPKALPPMPPQQPAAPGDNTGAPVAKEGEAAPGITADTGIYGYDLDRDDEDDNEQAGVAKRFMTIGEAREAGRQARDEELGAFRRFCRARRRAGQWRDFTFEYHSPGEARELNRAGAVTVAKAEGKVAVAGLAVLAADTGRVLMLQRALCDDDPAAGTWEFPGGHLEQDESPLAAAWREWAEETGAVPPPGVQSGTWTAGDGIYQGIVWTVDTESMVPVRGGAEISNPDDPDGDQVEAIAWWDPAVLAGNPAVRPELLASIGDVLPLLGCRDETSDPSQGDEATCPCGTPVVYDEMNGWQHADGSISHDDGESVSSKMAAVAKAYPDGQSYSSHAFRPTEGFPNLCHYCGVGTSDPHHAAYRDVAKAGDDGSPKARGPAGR
jgi:8-oxo-dGTP pyrophosphatase MutT (NUDIX family)